MSPYAEALLRLAHVWVRAAPRRHRGVHRRHPADPGHPRAAAAATPRRRCGRPASRCRTGPAGPGSPRCCGRSWPAGARARWCAGAVVVSVSDGWERGDPAVLGERMARLSRLAHRVVWVNPHRGKDGYRPVQGGMSAALPHVDHFLAGHSLATFAGWWRWSPMRDVLADLLRWWQQGRPAGLATVVATWRSAPRPPGAAMLVGPDGEAVGSVSGGCVEGAVYELGRQVDRDRHAGAAALRGQRRRRLGRRPDLRRDPRRLRRAGRPGRLRASCPGSRPTSGRVPVAVLHGDRAPRPGPARAAAWWSGRTPAAAGPGLGADRRRGHRRRPRPAGRRPQRDADLRPGRGAPRRGHARVRLRVRAASADDRLRGDRLRRRGRPDRRVPRLPGDGLRRPPGVRHPQPVRRGRRGRRRLAAPLSGRPRPRPAGSTPAPCLRC